MTEQITEQPDEAVDEALEAPQEPVEPTEQPDETHEQPDAEEEQDTFPRAVVEKLRKESAHYREKARKAETYARELFVARVAATGRLADPDDLPFDEALLDDHDALLAAVEELVARKPHLASRTPKGDVGAGRVSDVGATVDLAGILRQQV